MCTWSEFKYFIWIDSSFDDVAIYVCPFRDVCRLYFESNYIQCSRQSTIQVTQCKCDFWFGQLKLVLCIQDLVFIWIIQTASLDNFGRFVLLSAHLLLAMNWQLVRSACANTFPIWNDLNEYKIIVAMWSWYVENDFDFHSKFVSNYPNVTLGHQLGTETKYFSFQILQALMLVLFLWLIA